MSEYLLDPSFNNFRANLTLLRATRQLSCLELGRIVGVKPYKRIWDLESGRCNPKLSEIMFICKYFDVNMDDLLHKTATIKFVKA